MRTAAALVLIAVAAPARADRVKVHMDHLRPDTVSRFEKARVAWLASLAASHAHDQWGGTFLQIGGTAFFTLVAFDKWADLDAKVDTSKIDPSAQAAYNRDSDAGLVAPHANEIWVRTPEYDFGTVPANLAALGGVGVIDFETVEPDSTVYDATWKAVSAALTAAHSPLVRVAYFARYGSGKIVSLWLAPSAKAFSAAGKVEAILPAALAKQWRAIPRDEMPLIVRRDLSD